MLLKITSSRLSHGCTHNSVLLRQSSAIKRDTTNTQLAWKNSQRISNSSHSLTYEQKQKQRSSVLGNLPTSLPKSSPLMYNRSDVVSQSSLLQCIRDSKTTFNWHCQSSMFSSVLDLMPQVLSYTTADSTTLVLYLHCCIMHASPCVVCF